MGSKHKDLPYTCLVSTEKVIISHPYLLFPAKIQWWWDIYMQTQTSVKCECSFLFISLRNGAQTGEQQADDDRRGPFSRKSRSLTNANPPHYSQTSLAGSFPQQYRWLCTFIFMHLFMLGWICSFERLRQEDSFWKQTHTSRRRDYIKPIMSGALCHCFSFMRGCTPSFHLYVWYHPLYQWF